jgi:hypothetical protein
MCTHQSPVAVHGAALWTLLSAGPVRFHRRRATGGSHGHGIAMVDWLLVLVTIKTGHCCLVMAVPVLGCLGGGMVSQLTQHIPRVA